MSDSNDADGVLKKVFFIRAGDPRGNNATLVVDASREILKWLDAGLAFDIALERRDS